MSTVDEVRALLEGAEDERPIPTFGLSRKQVLAAAAPDLARAYLELAEAAQEVLRAGMEYNPAYWQAAYLTLEATISKPLRSSEPLRSEEEEGT